MPSTELAISMQVTDPARLAAFWSQVLAWPVGAGTNRAFAATGLTGRQLGGDPRRWRAQRPRSARVYARIMTGPELKAARPVWNTIDPAVWLARSCGDGYGAPEEFAGLPLCLLQVVQDVADGHAMDTQADDHVVQPAADPPGPRSLDRGMIALMTAAAGTPRPQCPA